MSIWYANKRVTLAERGTVKKVCVLYLAAYVPVQHKRRKEKKNKERKFSWDFKNGYKATVCLHFIMCLRAIKVHGWI